MALLEERGGGGGFEDLFAGEATTEFWNFPIGRTHPETYHENQASSTKMRTLA
jgi:hypothetical protein